MPGVSATQVSDDSDSRYWWRDEQQKQVDSFNQTGYPLRAAFPGSYLFNHVLVPSSDNATSFAEDLAIPDVSNIVYGYCSDAERQVLPDNTIVIDTDDNVVNSEVVSAIFNILSSTSVSKIAFLGEAAFHIYARHLQKICCNEIDIILIEPDWRSPVTLHGIYRQVVTTVFVNSTRVLDAAFTRCHCVLIADDKFTSDPAFGVLQQLLQKVGCEVMDESGNLRDVVPESHSTYHVIGNTVGALKQSQADADDWLFTYINTNTTVIIEPVHSALSGLSGMHERKTRLRRKMAKLYDDPKAFFRDSNNKLLRFVGQRLLTGNSTVS